MKRYDWRTQDMIKFFFYVLFYFIAFLLASRCLLS